MRDHNKLTAFNLADELAIAIYQVTKDFPKEELYGLVSQMRRAAVSVPSNIVEGCARNSQKEYVRFLEIAFGSLRELHYQYNLARRLDYVDASKAHDCEVSIIHVEKVLAALINSLYRK